MAAHKDIRIPFEIEGRRFEAVGLLKEGEPPVDGDEMLARTAGENGGAIGEEDEMFLREHLLVPPEALWWPRLLVTNRRPPDDLRYYGINSRCVSCFSFIHGRLLQFWHSLDDRWPDLCLVVRRCT